MQSRKQFIKSHGATCHNNKDAWRQSWSFINRSEKIIIFGAWDSNTDEDNVTLIFSENWRIRNGRKRAAYKPSREHIRLVEEEGFTLKTFPMQRSEANKDESGVDGRSKIGGFTPELKERVLTRDGRDWYASDEKLNIAKLAEEVGSSDSHSEGAVRTILVNSYERNGEARKKCVDHYGYSCAVCEFSFEDTYGSIGKDYIHVHHVVPLHKVQKEYKVDPIKDLIPVCPNCHAMIHRKEEVLTVEELKEHLKNRR